MAFSLPPPPVYCLPRPRGILVKRKINIKHSDTRIFSYPKGLDNKRNTNKT